MVKIILPLSKKRGREPPETIEAECQKKRKMDVTVKAECGKILKTLMTHEYGPIFNLPVDPVALCIPDYFSIISHPMDLGTIKRRLDGNKYFGAEEFAADVRLTFANAMQYNPPGNSVHLMAKAMNAVFKRNWEYLEAKWLRERKFITKQTEDIGKASRGSLPNTSISVEEKVSLKFRKVVRQQKFCANGRTKNTEATSKASHRLPAKTSASSEETTLTSSEEKTSMTAEEKTRLRRELMEALRGKLTGTLRGFLRKHGLICSNKETIEAAFGSFGTETLLALKRVVNSSPATTMVKDKDYHLTLQNKNGRSTILKVEDKSNIEARIRAARAAKEALLQNAKSEIQMKRERERERIEKMDRTATIEDNLMVLRELEKLCFVGQLGNHSLEIIGLRLKEEYQYVDDDLYEELEDGEIV